MQKAPQWPVFATSMAAFALVIALFALARTVHAPVAAPVSTTPVVQNDTEPVVTQPAEDDTWAGPGTYSSDEIGISFSVPEGYVVQADPDFGPSEFFNGQVMRLNVIDEALDTTVFRVQATTSDYELLESEGCCYFYTGTIDPAVMTVESMAAAIGTQLRNVMFPQAVDVSGTQGLRFNYTTGYVSTPVYEAVVVPADNDPYANVMFSVYLGEEDIDATVETIKANRTAWRDAETIATFDEILATVEWTK